MRFAASGFGTMSRSFVARGKPCAPTARPPISTYSMPASARAAISSSGANIGCATEVVLELGRDAAQPDGLRQARRHRAIGSLLPIRLASSLVLPHPPLYSLAVRHGSDRSRGRPPPAHGPLIRSTRRIARAGSTALG